MIGELAGVYRLKQKLGEGGTGETFLAEHKDSGQSAAVKILFPQICSDAAVIDRFFADIKAASLINHSGIADLFDCGRLPNGRAYVAGEYLQGKTLTDALIELGQVSDVESLADIAWQVATMLRAAHDAGIIHNCLKPDAIFLTFPPAQTPRPLVKLVDFGMAKFRHELRHSQTGSLLGAPLYMSPETGRGGSQVDHRSDIYSLGCIMFEMACGRPPFVREGQGELIIAHATEPAPFVSSLEPAIPPAIDQLIGRMLTKNPLARPQGMAEVATVLERFFKCPTPVAVHARASSPVFPLPQSPAPAFQKAVPAMVAPLPVPPVGDVPAPAPPVNSNAVALVQTLAAPPAEGRPAGPTNAKAVVASKGELAAGSTAMLPPEPLWLGKVRQRTTMIEPGASIPVKVRAAAPASERAPLRPTGRRSSGRGLAVPDTNKKSASPPVNLSVVVISAAVLLVIAAVVLLVTRAPSRPPEKPRRESHASGALLPESQSRKPEPRPMPKAGDPSIAVPAPESTTEPRSDSVAPPSLLEPDDDNGTGTDPRSSKDKDKNHPRRFW